MRGSLTYRSSSVLVLIMCVVSMAGCSMPMAYKRDITNHTPLPPLKLPLPSGHVKKAEAPFMVAFVAVSYDSAMERFVNVQTEFLQRLQAQSQMYGNTAQGYRKMDAAQADYFETVKRALQADLEQTLLAKKIRVLGPFKTRDEMTFDEKKRAIYAFTPEIFIKVDSESTRDSGMTSGYVENGRVIVSGSVILVLRESITGEKLWVKRLDLDPFSEPYRFVAKYKEPYRMVGSMGYGLLAGVREEDTSDQALARALTRFYEGLGDKLWRHIDPEEWEKYLNQAQRVREGKRF